MAQFTTTNLTGERVLVRGTDQFGTEGQTIVHAEQWNDIKARSSHLEAHENFDAAVEEFFAPLMEAADLLNSSAQPKVDPISYVVLQEGTEAQQGQDEIAVKLSVDSIVLRLLEQGDYGRLVWVNDQLEVLEVMDFDDDTGNGDNPVDEILAEG